MAYIIDGPRVTRHVSFTQRENSLLCRRAAEVGMAVVPFIKNEALYGKTKGYSLTSISQHTKSIDAIIRGAREVADQQHPNRWLYQADLEHISDQLDQLIAAESAILQELRKKLK